VLHHHLPRLLSAEHCVIAVTLHARNMCRVRRPLGKQLAPLDLQNFRIEIPRNGQANRGFSARFTFNKRS
jgi:hypothetical protein